MRSLNKVILIGNLTRDPETRITMGNQTLTIFGIATNRDWVTKDGRNEQSVEFHEIVCFNGLAEIAKRSLKKGSLVNIEGYLKTRSWDDASGIKKFRTEIIADSLIMLDKRLRDPAFPASNHRGISSPEGAFDTTQATISIENPATI